MYYPDNIYMQNVFECIFDDLLKHCFLTDSTSNLFQVQRKSSNLILGNHYNLHRKSVNHPLSQLSSLRESCWSRNTGDGDHRNSHGSGLVSLWHLSSCPGQRLGSILSPALFYHQLDTTQLCWVDGYQYSRLSTLVDLSCFLHNLIIITHFGLLILQ